MTTNMENAQLKSIIAETMDEKLDPLKKDIENIKVKLGNHVEHLTDKLNVLEKNNSQISTDVDWLKKLFDPKECARTDAQQSADIAWIKWGILGVVGAGIAQIVNIIFQIIQK